MGYWWKKKALYVNRLLTFHFKSIFSESANDNLRFEDRLDKEQVYDENGNPLPMDADSRMERGSDLDSHSSRWSDAEYDTDLEVGFVITVKIQNIKTPRGYRNFFQ
jgi:hypothetical protein